MRNDVRSFSGRNTLMIRVILKIYYCSIEPWSERSWNMFRTWIGFDTSAGHLQIYKFASKSGTHTSTYCLWAEVNADHLVTHSSNFKPSSIRYPLPLLVIRRECQTLGVANSPSKTSWSCRNNSWRGFGLKTHDDCQYWPQRFRKCLSWEPWNCVKILPICVPYTGL